jgi:hypothetical protein
VLVSSYVAYRAGAFNNYIPYELRPRASRPRPTFKAREPVTTVIGGSKSGGPLGEGGLVIEPRASAAAPADQPSP